MTKGIIDRFEGGFALIETDEGMVQIARDRLPADSQEGDCVTIDDEQSAVDQVETEGRKAQIKQRLRSLFAK